MLGSTSKYLLRTCIAYRFETWNYYFAQYADALIILSLLSLAVQTIVENSCCG